jgi:hypothetical protein
LLLPLNEYKTGMLTARQCFLDLSVGSMLPFFLAPTHQAYDFRTNAELLDYHQLCNVMPNCAFPTSLHIGIMFRVSQEMEDRFRLSFNDFLKISKCSTEC